MNKASELDFFVKITVSFVGSYGAQAVVYYRNRIPMHMLTEWSWYFEYLVALVKVAHPHRRVTLDTGIQTMLQGKEYVEGKTRSLLRAKRGQLKKLLASVPNDDLFGTQVERNMEKAVRVKREIEELERGEFKYYIPPTYINEIKKWIKQTLK